MLDSCQEYVADQWRDGQVESVRTWVAEEVPVALVYNGVSHAVMLASPHDLATIDIVFAKEEMRVGDRLIAEPPRELLNYVPRAPSSPITGQIVSVYGNAVAIAAENQVVVVNRGKRDGLERGHVMALLTDGQRLQDKTDSARPQIKLPNERNGLMMVFKTFDNLSYALVLQVSDGVRVGDRFANPN